jgi:hypothetical protein
MCDRIIQRTRSVHPNIHAVAEWLMTDADGTIIIVTISKNGRNETEM